MTDSKNSAPHVTHIDYTDTSSNTKTDDVKIDIDLNSRSNDGATGVGGSPAYVGIPLDEKEKERRIKEKGSVEILTHDGPEAKLKDKNDYRPGTFAVLEHQRNDDKNRYREDTNTVPILVRRIDSQEVLPRPFKSTLQLIIVSYISCLFCPCFGAWAAKYALKTKVQRNRGNYQAATRSGRRACNYIIPAFVVGLILLALGLGIGLGLSHDD